MLDLELYSLYNLSQSCTLGQISVVVEEKPGGLFFIGNSTFKGANALILDERKEIWKN